MEAFLVVLVASEAVHTVEELLSLPLDLAVVAVLLVGVGDATRLDLGQVSTEMVEDIVVFVLEQSPSAADRRCFLAVTLSMLPE